MEVKRLERLLYGKTWRGRIFENIGPQRGSDENGETTDSSVLESFGDVDQGKDTAAVGVGLFPINK